MGNGGDVGTNGETLRNVVDQVDDGPRFDLSLLEVALNLLRNPRGLSIQVHQRNVCNKMNIMKWDKRYQEKG